MCNKKCNYENYYIKSDNINGKVKIGSELWSARSLEPIEVGTTVRIVSTEGVHVVVEVYSEE